MNEGQLGIVEELHVQLVDEDKVAVSREKIRLVRAAYERVENTFPKDADASALMDLERWIASLDPTA